MGWNRAELAERLRVTRGEQPLGRRRQHLPNASALLWRAIGIWSFRRRHRVPMLVVESDPGRRELLRSQLSDTLRYGWPDQTSHDGKQFFSSLGPVDDTADIVEGLSKRR